MRELFGQFAVLFREPRVGGREMALGDKIEQAIDTGFQMRLPRLELSQLLAPGFDRVGSKIEPARKEIAKSLGNEEPLLDRIEDDVVEFRPGDAAAPADGYAGSCPVGATIILIPPALAGDRRHAAAATISTAAAARQADQKIVRGRHPGGLIRGTPFDETALRGFEIVGGDNRWNGNRNPFALGPAFARFGIALVVERNANIGGVPEHRLHVRNMKLPPAVFISVAIEPVGEPSDAQRWFPRWAEKVEFEYLAHDERLVLGDHQLALALGALSLGFIAFVAQGWRLSVPESHFRICEHRTGRVLGIFEAMIFVEKCEHADRKFGCRVIAEGLRDRDDAHLRALQHCAILHEVHRVAEQSRQGMHQDHVIGTLIAGRGRNHRLKLRSGVVGSTRAGLDDGVDNDSSVLLTPAIEAFDLIGNRQVVLCLF